MNFKRYLEEQQYSKTTITGIEKAVLNFITWLDGEGTEVENARQADVLAYVKSCQKRAVTQRTIQQYVAAIKNFIRL